MRPQGLKTKIFLDSGDPEETKKTISLLGFLDGQTTNPSLVAKNPQVREKILHKGKLTRESLLSIYEKIVQDISKQIPQGSVSVEVYADLRTSYKEMYEQAKKMFKWIPNAHIKFPTTVEGIKAARVCLQDGMKVNMTLCFTQDQAASVYSATLGSKKGDVFISPFDGRLEDVGQNGIDLVKDIQKMYQKGDGHVEILAASIRNLEHFLYLISIGIDIITAPYSVLSNWAERGFVTPDLLEENIGDLKDMKEIKYKDIDLNLPWDNYIIVNELTEKGIAKFSTDWDSLL